jgi:hypothetical protein
VGTDQLELSLEGCREHRLTLIEALDAGHGREYEIAGSDAVGRAVRTAEGVVALDTRRCSTHGVGKTR